jgi:ubiquinone biosynthesis protein COQ9
MKAQNSEQKLLSTLVTQAVDSTNNISNLVSNQENLVTSFSSLLNKVSVLMKLGDEILWWPKVPERPKPE